jgi:hypothetical protein
MGGAELGQRNADDAEIGVCTKRACCCFSKQSVASEERSKFRFRRHPYQPTVAERIPAASYCRIGLDTKFFQQRNELHRHVGVK